MLFKTHKVCFKCNENKPLTEFYKHPKMADGRVNKCVVCNKQDVTANRNLKIDVYRAYDKERGSRKTKEDLQKYRDKNPKKYSAHSKVGHAVRDGRLVPGACKVCGNLKVHGHHMDYNKPLDVMWLCAEHHRAWHKVNGEGANAHSH